MVQEVKWETVFLEARVYKQIRTARIKQAGAEEDDVKREWKARGGDCEL